MNKRGFTLVELSIVLVIIGLLIGGILVAKSMIQTAKINAQIKEVTQYFIAIDQFKTKFKDEMPGDSSMVTPITVDSPINGIPNESGSRGRFWPNLINSGVTTKEIVATSDNGGGKNCPLAAWGKDSVICFTANNFDESFAGGNFAQFNANALRVHARTVRAGYTSAEWTPTFTVGEMTAIDTKIDDGRPRSGKVFAYGVWFECTDGAWNVNGGFAYYVAANLNNKACDAGFIYERTVGAH